jgi:hypothetical protein
MTFKKARATLVKLKVLPPKSKRAQTAPQGFKAPVGERGESLSGRQSTHFDLLDSMFSFFMTHQHNSH